MAFILAMIQPIMAALRPHPGTAKRWIFNWAHWAFGNLALLFAILAIFFAMEYKIINMPKEVSYVLITYVIVHVLGHLVLSIQRCFVDHHGSNKIKNLDDSHQAIEDAPGSRLRKAVAFVYIGLVWTFAFVIVAWLVHQKLHSEVSFCLSFAMHCLLINF